MEPIDRHGLGYGAVDDDPNVSVLLDTMDATSRWEATEQLRSWERRQLGIRPGMRVIDVGCGLGDVALAFASDVGPDGEVVGIDASAEMIAAASGRAASVAARTRFAVGDALALGEPDRSFDAARSERTLQWLARPESAVREMKRVVRDGGLVSLIDTDWSTYRLDYGRPEMSRRISAVLGVERRRASNIGARLVEIVEHADLEVVGQMSATQSWRTWDPDAAPAPSGCFSMPSLAADLVEGGAITPEEAQDFVAEVERAARSGTFRMALTMHAVLARVHH